MAPFYWNQSTHLLTGIVNKSFDLLWHLLSLSSFPYFLYHFCLFYLFHFYLLSVEESAAERIQSLSSHAATAVSCPQTRQPHVSIRFNLEFIHVCMYVLFVFKNLSPHLYLYPCSMLNESRLVVEQRLTPSYIIIMVIICLK